MLTLVEKDKIRSEEIYRNELREELLRPTTPPKNWLVAFLNSPFSIWLLSTLALVMISNFIIPSKIFPVNAGMFSEIDKQRDRAEQAVLTLKSDRNDVTPADYDAAEAAYKDARLAFNDWIYTFTNELAFDKFQPSEVYSTTLNSAIVKNEFFLMQANRIHQAALAKRNGSSMAATTQNLSIKPLLEVGENLLPKLFDAELKIWQEYKAANDETRAEMERILESKKWKFFEQIQ